MVQLEQPSQGLLELCVRLWQLGDFYGIKTLATSAKEQLQKRTERHIEESGHVARMMAGVPFVSDMEGAIRAAWDPEKASGSQRQLLLSLCQAVAPYLRDCPRIIALFDDIPGFASDFSKAVLGCEATFLWPPQSRACQVCRRGISTKDADLRASTVICHSTGTLAALNGSLGGWYCSRNCYEKTQHPRLMHKHCQLCMFQRFATGQTDFL